MPMKLTHVELRNWRNFAHIEFDLNTRLFVVGPNASGKSNLLGAMRFISDVAKQGLMATSPYYGDPNSYIRNNEVSCYFNIGFNESDSHFEYNLEVSSLTGLRPELSGQVDWEGRAVRTHESFQANGQDVNIDSIPSRLADLTEMEFASNGHPLTGVHNALSGIRYIHPNPKKMLERGRYDEHATGFTQRVASLPDAVLEPAIARIRPILASIVPEVPNLTYERRGTGKDLDFYSDSYTGESNTSTVFSQYQFSEGTLRILGILFELAVLPEGASLVLIEEPELFMQPSVVRSLPDFFAAVAADKDVQMIITTHSPELIDNELIRPDQVLMLEPTDTGTKGTLLSESQDPRVRSFVETGFPLSNAVDSVSRRRIPLGIWERR